MYSPSLSNFLVIAQFMNISEAARHLHVTQQALSSYLKRLEQHYGQELFTRRPSLMLTPAGKHVLKVAREIEQLHLQLEETIRADADRIGSVNMGFMRPKVRHYSKYIPLMEYRALFPDVSLRIVEETSEHLEEMTADRRLDFYVGDGLVERDGLGTVYLFSDQYYLTVSDELLRRCFAGEYPDCLRRFARGVDLEDFLDLPQFAFPEHIHMAAQMKRFYDENGLDPNIAGENPGIEMNMQLVLHGAGYTVCPGYHLPAARGHAADLGLPPFHAFPVTRPVLTRPMAIVYRKNEIYPEYAARLMEMIESTVKNSEV